MNTYINVGDTIQGKKLVFEGSHLKVFDLYMKSRSHRGQRAYLFNGKCWIEVAYDIKESTEQIEKKDIKKSQKRRPKKQLRRKNR